MPEPKKVNIVLLDSGHTISLPEDEAAQLIEAGRAVPEPVSAGGIRSLAERTEQVFSEPLEQLQAFGEGGLSALTLGLSDLAADDNTRARAAVNPGSRFAGEVVGSLAGLGALGSGAGATALKATPLGATVATSERLLGGIGSPTLRLAAQGAFEGIPIGAGQALSDAAIHNKPLTAEALVGGMVSGAIAGGVVGGSLGLLVKGGHTVVQDGKTALGGGEAPRLRKAAELRDIYDSELDDVVREVAAKHAEEEAVRQAQRQAQRAAAPDIEAISTAKREIKLHLERRKKSLAEDIKDLDLDAAPASPRARRIFEQKKAQAAEIEGQIKAIDEALASGDAARMAQVAREIGKVGDALPHIERLERVAREGEPAVEAVKRNPLEGINQDAVGYSVAKVRLQQLEEKLGDLDDIYKLPPEKAAEAVQAIDDYFLAAERLRARAREMGLLNENPFAQEARRALFGDAPEPPPWEAGENLPELLTPEARHVWLEYLERGGFKGRVDIRPKSPILDNAAEEAARKAPPTQVDIGEPTILEEGGPTIREDTAPTRETGAPTVVDDRLRGQFADTIPDAKGGPKTVRLERPTGERAAGGEAEPPKTAPEPEPAKTTPGGEAPKTAPEPESGRAAQEAEPTLRDEAERLKRETGPKTVRIRRGPAAQLTRATDIPTSPGEEILHELRRLRHAAGPGFVGSVLRLTLRAARAAAHYGAAVVQAVANNRAAQRILPQAAARQFSKDELLSLAERLRSPEYLDELRRKARYLAVSEGSPELSLHLDAALERKVRFLADKAPKDPLADTGIKSYWKPSDAELAHWRRYVQAAEDPAGTLAREVRGGVVSTETLEVLQEVYPALYAEIQMAIIDNLPVIVRLPYERRLLAGQLLGAPIDPTQTPDLALMLQAGRAAEDSRRKPGGGIPRSIAALRGAVDQTKTKAQRLTER